MPKRTRRKTMRNFDGFYKGIDLGGWISQCGSKYNDEHYSTFITEKDIEKIATMGLDHVQIGRAHV